MRKHKKTFTEYKKMCQKKIEKEMKKNNAGEKRSRKK